MLIFCLSVQSCGHVRDGLGRLSGNRIYLFLCLSELTVVDVINGRRSEWNWSLVRNRGLFAIGTRWGI